jgi:hypothetical protein
VAAKGHGDCLFTVGTVGGDLDEQLTAFERDLA